MVQECPLEFRDDSAHYWTLPHYLVDGFAASRARCRETTTMAPCGGGTQHLGNPGFSIEKGQKTPLKK